MSRVVRKKMVQELAARYRGQENFVVVDPRGLTALESVELRAEMHKNDLHMSVVKNSILRHALKDAGLESLEKILGEMNALVYGPDPVTIAKVVHEFQKKADKRPAVRGGLLDGEPIDAAQVRKLSHMPTRDQLIGMLLCAMQGSTTALARVLNEIPTSFARVLKAVADKG